MNYLPFVIRALATWRLAHLLMYEAGPANVLVRFRSIFGVRHDSEGQPVAYPDGSVFECFLCFSVWTGAVTAFAPLSLLRMLSLSALAIWAEKWYGKG